MCVGRIIFVVILASFFLLMFLLKRDAYKGLFCGFVISAAVLSFFAEPIYDLWNYYYGSLAYMKPMPFSAFWENYGDADEVLAKFYFFLISKLPFKGFLPLITTLIVYGILFAMLWRCAQRENAPKKYMLLAAVFLVCTTKYYSVLAGVRNHLAFAIFAVALESELLEGKHKWLCWLCYFGAAMIHSSLAVFLLLRLLLLVYRRFSKPILLFVLLLISTFINPLLEWLDQNIDNRFIHGLVEKADAYYGQNTADNLSFGNQLTAWAKIACVVLLVVYALYLAKHWNWDKKWGNYLHYVLLATAFTVGATGSQHTLVRMPELLGFLVIPVLLKALPEGAKTEQTEHKTCIRAKPTQYSPLLYNLFTLESALFVSFQFLGTFTLLNLIWPPV